MNFSHDLLSRPNTTNLFFFSCKKIENLCLVRARFILGPNKSIFVSEHILVEHEAKKLVKVPRNQKLILDWKSKEKKSSLSFGLILNHWA